MPRNIVVLSDGTGNAAGSRTPTNVWRLYQALDLSDPESQVAFYDDGVGTERWKPLRMIGGAFGYGLKRNVLEMYRFLSRSYRDGDRIFVFGFSRGAYAVRVLVGLVHHCGLIGGARSEAELREMSRARYKVFRRRFSNVRTRLQDSLTGRRDSSREAGWRHEDAPPIAFVGVWDTVDAYGLPIDEMATAWDRFIYPYRFPDFRLSPIVGQAAHALALDDERHTFHPVLWDESGENPAEAAGEGRGEPRERIRQVWFAGAHANVGGGYADDTLAHVPLDWMLSEIEDAEGRSPLTFVPNAREALARKADIHGKLYNSRSGLQTYYRFKPRNVMELCDDPVIGVTAKPRIHESVFLRIGEAAEHYAPFALPKDYEVVPLERGAAMPTRETPVARHLRADAEQGVWDLVHWRRWLYMTLLVATLAVVISPAVLPWSEAGACPDTGPLCAAESVLNLLSPLLPEWSVAWQKALGQNPSVLLILLLIFVVQFVASRLLRGAVGRHAAAAWRISFAEGTSPGSGGAPQAPLAPVLTRITRRLRTLCTGNCAARRNMALAVVAMAFMAVAAVMLANKLSYSVGAAFGLTCSNSERPTRLTASAGPETVTLDVRDPCLATGLTLVGGERYTIAVKPLPAPGVAPAPPDDPYVWRDGDIPAGPDGLDPDAVEERLSWFGQRALKVGVTARRVWTEDWFVVIGQIGENSLQPFAIGSGLERFTSPATGELYVYVNDGVLGLPFLWDWAYYWSAGENRGTAEITVAPYRAPRTSAQ